MRAFKLVAILLALVFAAGACCLAAPQQASPQWWGKAPGQKPEIAGTVANVSPTSIGVQTKDGVKSFTVADKTVVMIHGAKAAIADVKVGDMVVVHFRPVPNGVPIAARINVPKPSARGKITSIEGNVIMLQNPTATEKVVVSADTKYLSHGYVGTIADLRVGYRVVAIGTENAGETDAATIEFVPQRAEGAVTAVENGVITIKTVRQRTLQLQTSPATAVLIRPRVGPNKKGSISDVQVGVPVNVGFHINATGPSPLLWIEVLTGS